MSFDYNEITVLVEKLEASNLSIWADKMKDCMGSGSTVTEILMCLNWNLREFLKENKFCPNEIQNEALRINSEISALINDR